jgi:D-glycero-D-manno-heptose 1,7-bisphosphate phosphatase
LHHAHYHVVVINDEPAIGEGRMDGGALVRVNARMARELADAGGRVDAVFYCPHKPDEGCACRLPGTGLLLELQQRLEIDLTGVPMISDSLAGVQAAQTLNMRPVLVMSSTQAMQALLGVAVHNDLSAAVTALLARQEVH